VRRLLVDTGPLIAWFDAGDAHHETVARYLETFDGELLSSWPVLTETCHLLPQRMVPAFMQWVADGGLTIAELPASATSALAERLGKYADLPMDLADATLIWLTERLGVFDVLTLDRRDFGIYRSARGKALRNVLETPAAKKRGRSG
jgi:predicted nucleic acid-binding protein